MDILNTIFSTGIIPVIKLTDVTLAGALGDALLAGDVPCAEVTFRAAGAAQAIRRMREACPEMVVGAGTVLRVDQAREAIDAGAQFIVSPGTNPAVVSYVRARGVPVLPGVMTPTEIEQALSLGLSTVKFFPAEQAGGVAMLRALGAPYGEVRFVPTGGIGLENIAEYMKLPCVAACGGSYMVTQKLLDERDFAGITKLCKTTVRLIRGVRK